LVLDKLISTEEGLLFHPQTCPTPKVGQRDQVLLVYVPYLEHRVAETSKGIAYVRKGDDTIQLRDSEKRELEYAKGRISFEDETACEYSEDILVTEILDELRHTITAASGAAADMTAEQILLSRHLLRKENGKLYFTKAGLLLLV
jgi:predicted HTH transcriptional regulator